MADNRLYRSVHGRVIGGVAGGLADFFGMDPTIVRLIFVLLAVFGGGGVLLYIILWVVIPEKSLGSPYSNFTAQPNTPPASNAGVDTGVGETYEGFDKGRPVYASQQDYAPKRKFEGSLIGGLVLILIGSFFLFERFIPNINFGDFWPLLLVVVGVVLIINNFPRKESGLNDENTEGNGNV
ncbi:MAG: PspC domain-containing protein [Lentimicrobiaceae bacterium]|nr:PspC domain-containing protein [Lentimicrobiaceae bacterium]MCO5265109.1 PspC domain-containing protein [Lentimicrobium sp.]HPG33843.1 PspC domain-containing protein [Lentimicrobium sp.]